MYLSNLNAEIVACILFTKLQYKPNLKCTSKYGFSPDLGGKMAAFRACACKLSWTLLYGPLGFSPYKMRKERRVQGLDYTLLWCSFGAVSLRIHVDFLNDERRGEKRKTGDAAACTIH